MAGLRQTAGHIKRVHKLAVRITEGLRSFLPSKRWSFLFCREARHSSGHDPTHHSNIIPLHFIYCPLRHCFCFISCHALGNFRAFWVGTEIIFCPNLFRVLLPQWSKQLKLFPSLFFSYTDCGGGRKRACHSHSWQGRASRAAVTAVAVSMVHRSIHLLADGVGQGVEGGTSNGSSSV